MLISGSNEVNQEKRRTTANGSSNAKGNVVRRIKLRMLLCTIGMSNTYYDICIILFCVESLLDSSPVNGKKTLGACEMCSNYEAQLLNAQQKIHDLEKHIVALERYKQELSKETAFRKDMEEKWNEKKEEYKEQVTIL